METFGHFTFLSGGALSFLLSVTPFTFRCVCFASTRTCARPKGAPWCCVLECSAANVGSYKHIPCTTENTSIWWPDARPKIAAVQAIVSAHSSPTWHHFQSWNNWCTHNVASCSKTCSKDEKALSSTAVRAKTSCCQRPM